MADRNYRSYADVDGVYINSEEIAPPDPGNYADTLKFSNAHDVEVIHCTILGSAEDAVDCNRTCRNIVIRESQIYPGGKYAFTIKGGSARITLSDIMIFGGGSVCEIELGNWSDQSFAKSTGIVLDNVRRADGKPVRVRVGRANAPTIIGGNVKIDRLGSLLLKAYWWVKYATFKLGLR